MKILILTSFRSKNQVFEVKSQDSESSAWLSFRFSVRTGTGTGVSPRILNLEPFTVPPFTIDGVRRHSVTIQNDVSSVRYEFLPDTVHPRVLVSILLTGEARKKPGRGLGTAHSCAWGGGWGGGQS